MNNQLKPNLDNLITRDEYLKDFKSFVFSPFIKIIVGTRRVGKSYFLYQVIKKLLREKIFSEKQIFYVNKEWLEFDEIKDYKSLYSFFLDWKEKNKIGNRFFVGIDEIQEIQDW